MLLDIPDAGLQAVLQHTTTADVANLRLVSKEVCKRTTQHTPYVSLRLSASGYSHDLDDWFQATKRLQHVPVVHIHIHRALLPEMLEPALGAMSQQRQVTALHLIGVNGAAHSNDDPAKNRILAANYSGYILSLQPIRHLKHSLKTLVIKDLSIRSLEDDLQYLSREPGDNFQLQQLTLHAAWTGKGKPNVDAAGFLTVLKLLPQIFPRLQQLNLGVPWTTGSVWNTLEPALSEVQTYVEGSQMKVVGILAGVAAAISQLQHLQALTLTELPDTWAALQSESSDESVVPPPPTLNYVPADLPGSIMALLTAAGFFKTSRGSGSDAVLDQEPLRSLPLQSAAAAACSTMDSVGCWLLQQQPKLMQVQLGCGNWSMTWRKETQQPEQPNYRSAAVPHDEAAVVASATAAELVAMKAEYSADKVGHDSVAGSSGSDSMLDDFKRHLSRYSSRPASILLPLISRLALTLYPGCWFVDGSLVTLLREMTSLKELEVSLLAGPKQPNTMVAAILASAAAVPELTSLKLCVSGTKPLCITDSLLLPLTAAAGGPKKLETLHLAAGFGRTADNDAIRGWCVLQHLKCLRNLSIRQLGDTILSFPRDSLPASVEVFGSKGFILVESPDVGDATEGDGSAVHMHC